MDCKVKVKVAQQLLLSATSHSLCTYSLLSLYYDYDITLAFMIVAMESEGKRMRNNNERSDNRQRHIAYHSYHLFATHRLIDSCCNCLCLVQTIASKSLDRSFGATTQMVVHHGTLAARVCCTTHKHNSGTTTTLAMMIMTILVLVTIGIPPMLGVVADR
jgi:hypothetical protein